MAETGRGVTEVRMATVASPAKVKTAREGVAKEEAVQVVAVAPGAPPKVSRVGTSVTEGGD